MMTERRVLILDDDPAVGTLLELVAQSGGAATRLTLLPEPFLASLDEWLPTHIVIDLQMPAMSGSDVLAELALRGCRARIVITSGNVDEIGAARRAFETALDIAGTLPKPFAAASLRALLR